MRRITSFQYYSMLDSFHIAVLPGDGIGPEVMAPALAVLDKVAASTPGLKFRFTEAPAGAGHYRDTGKSMPASTIKLCEEADAILLGACGLPRIRYPDNTEIMPQVELRFIFDLYAGVRPCRLIPNVPSPIVGAAERGIDLVVIRESTEGLFASMGKGVVTDTEARETLVITRKTSQRLFDFSFRLARRRKARGRPGLLTCVDKANAFKAYAFFRGMFDERRAPSRRRYRSPLRRRLFGDAGAAAVGLRRVGDGEHVRRHHLGSDRRPDRRHGHGALGRHRRHARGVPALPRHRARHHGQGPGQSDRHDSLRRADARLARRPSWPWRRRTRRARDRERRRSRLCGGPQALRIRRPRRHRRDRERHVARARRPGPGLSWVPPTILWDISHDPHISSGAAHQPWPHVNNIDLFYRWDSSHLSSHL
jgi:hypothetical protein